MHIRSGVRATKCHIIRSLNGRCRVHSIKSLLLVLFCLLALQSHAKAYPGPGIWSDVTPPDPLGGQAQLSAYFGTLYLYSTSVWPGSMGVSLDVRLAPWAFVSVSGEYSLYPIAGFGPTFIAGKKSPKAVRIVIAPRLGLDSRGEGDTPDPVFGGHLLFDAPMSPGGELRWCVGLLYSYSGAPNQPTYSSTLFALGGIRFHIHRRMDLAILFAGNPYFRTNYKSDCCWAGLSLFNITFQFTYHFGKLDDQRAVIPPPELPSDGSGS